MLSVFRAPPFARARATPFFGLRLRGKILYGRVFVGLTLYLSFTLGFKKKVDRDMAAWPGGRGLSRVCFRATSGPFGELLSRLLRSSSTPAVQYHSSIGSSKAHIKLQKPGH